MKHRTEECTCVACQRQRLILACTRRIKDHGPNAVVSCRFVLEHMREPKA